jgi:hypothetical protein
MLAITAVAFVALGLAYVLRRNRRPHGIGAFRQGNSTVPPGLIVTDSGRDSGPPDATAGNGQREGELESGPDAADSTGADAGHRGSGGNGSGNGGGGE